MCIERREELFRKSFETHQENVENFKTMLEVDGVACQTALEKSRKCELVRHPFRWDSSEATSSFVDATETASVDCGKVALQLAVIQSRLLNVADTGNWIEFESGEFIEYSVFKSFVLHNVLWHGVWCGARHLHTSLLYSIPPLSVACRCNAIYRHLVPLRWHHTLNTHIPSKVREWP